MKETNDKGNLLRTIGEIVRASLRGIGGVLRTQVLLSLITFVLLCVGFVLIGIPWWGLIALAIALFDSIPVVGSGMIMIPWALILLITGSGTRALHLLILYAVIFLVRQILDPVLNGKHIGVRPIWTFLSTVLATLAFGPWGLLLGSVIAIVIKTALDIRGRKRQQDQDQA